MTLEEVYDQHFDYVWRSLRRLGVPASDAEDAAHDVFIVVHRKLEQFEGRSKLTTWLFSICFRVAQNRMSRASVRREVATEPNEAWEDEQADVAKQVEQREGLALLEQSLLAMPIEQRSVFVLFELERLPSEKIAEALGIPLGTVYSRLRLARKCFQRFVDRHQAHERTYLNLGGTSA